MVRGMSCPQSVRKSIQNSHIYLILLTILCSIWCAERDSSHNFTPNLIHRFTIRKSNLHAVISITYVTHSIISNIFKLFKIFKEIWLGLVRNLSVTGFASLLNKNLMNVSGGKYSYVKIRRWVG